MREDGVCVAWRSGGFVGLVLGIGGLEMSYVCALKGCVRCKMLNGGGVGRGGGGEDEWIEVE